MLWCLVLLKYILFYIFSMKKGSLMGLWLVKGFWLPKGVVLGTFCCEFYNESLGLRWWDNPKNRLGCARNILFIQLYCYVCPCLKGLKKKITQNTDKIDALIVFGEGLIQRSAPEDAALIEDELENLHSYCQEVFSRVGCFHQRLTSPQHVCYTSLSSSAFHSLTYTSYRDVFIYPINFSLSVLNSVIWYNGIMNKSTWLTVGTSPP